MAADQAMPSGRGAFVPETRFGLWFLNTQTWSDRVLRVALKDLRRMMDRPDARYEVVLDVGCGHGRSLPLLMDAFNPRQLIAIERDGDVLGNARLRALDIGPAVTLVQADCARLPLRDGSEAICSTSIRISPPASVMGSPSPS